MIISILNYALAALLLVYGFRVRFRRSDTQNTQLIFYYFFIIEIKPLPGITLKKQG